MHSINYGDLLRRQQHLQDAGRLPAVPPDQVRVALACEIGELIQACKPDWVWWNKPGMRRELDRAAVLDEAADVLHFCLLLDLTRGRTPESGGWGDLVPYPGPLYGYHSTLLALLDDDQPSGWYRTAPLCSLLQHHGFTPHDLAAAYWAKSTENLKRWGVGA